MVATRCHILRKNTPNSISAGALPRPPGSLQHSPEPIAGLKGSLLLRKGRGGDGREKREGQGRRWEKGTGGEGTQEAQKGLQHQAQLGLNRAWAQLVGLAISLVGSIPSVSLFIIKQCKLAYQPRAVALYDAGKVTADLYGPVDR